MNEPRPTGLYKPCPPGMTADQLVDLHETAADWISRQRAVGWTADDEQALAAWLDASPLHRDIYASMGRTRQLFAQLPQFRADAARAASAAPGRSAAAAVTSRPARTLGFWHALARRPAFMPALAVLACVLLGGGWFAWDNTPRYQLSLVTGTHDTRTVDLPDGSRIAVNVGSQVEVRYYPRRREVVLAQGEAFFNVAASTSRPFTVDAGPSRITVVGTAFNVRAAPHRLVVTVLEGRVEVLPGRDPARGGPLLLRANAGIAVDPATGRHQVLAAAPETVGDWRSGHVRLLRMPLGELVQELARYLGQPVVLASQELASLPVSGFLATATPERFLELLPDLVPVRVQRDGEGWIVVKR